MQKNTRSTKTQRQNLDDEIQPTVSEPRTGHVFAETVDLTGQIFTDQTGCFLVPSVEGYNYIMVLYDYDSNVILARPMKSRTKEQMILALQPMLQTLEKSGFKPRLQRLDNETSEALTDFLDSKDIKYQFTPVASQRANAAERAIRTYKNHLIANFAGADPWAKCLDQLEVTLNLLRNSHINPKLSSYAQLYGPFDFNRTPLGPLGCKVIIRDMPDQRGTWSPHATNAFYIGREKDHYRCYKTWVPETRGE